jgi:predicted secreted Zn-dependent protease
VNRFVTVLLAGVLPLAAASAALAQVYKWTDAEGRVHYGPLPPRQVKATKLNYAPSRNSNAHANVEIEESTIQYYPVRGHTPLELHMSMMQNGPFNEIVKRRVYAEIHWRFKWKFDYTAEPGNCRVSKFAVTLVTTITMPKWMDEQTAPAETRSLWPQVVSKIRQHEEGHKAIGVEGANVLARRLQALPAYESCEALNSVINSLGERIYGEYALANSAFDRTEALKGSPFAN